MHSTTVHAGSNGGRLFGARYPCLQRDRTRVQRFLESGHTHTVSGALGAYLFLSAPSTEGFYFPFRISTTASTRRS